MALTAKGQPGGLATLDANGDMLAAQLPAAAAVADVAEANADGTYDAGTAALINELKAQLNGALAALRTAGLMETS